MINKRTLERYAFLLASEKPVQKVYGGFSASWVPYSNTADVPGYYKTPYGFTRCVGLVKSGSLGSTAITLPDTHRPPHSHSIMNVGNSGQGTLTISQTGTIAPSGGTNAYHTLYCGMPTMVDNWSLVSYQNSWVDWGSPYAPTAYMKDIFGIVHIQGHCKSGTSGQAIFTLPVGYRPEYEIVLPVPSLSTTFGEIRIQTDGDVVHISGNTGFIGLSNISFISSTSPLNDSWQDLTLQNSWVNYGGGFAPAQALETPWGEIYLRGLIKDGTTTANTVISALPQTPSMRYFNPTVSNGVFGYTVVETDSDLAVGVASATWLSLDMVRYQINWLAT